MLFTTGVRNAHTDIRTHKNTEEEGTIDATRART